MGVGGEGVRLRYSLKSTSVDSKSKSKVSFVGLFGVMAIVIGGGWVRSTIGRLAKVLGMLLNDVVSGVCVHKNMSR